MKLSRVRGVEDESVVERWMGHAGVGLLWLGLLLFSSPQYRLVCWLVGCVLLIWAGWGRVMRMKWGGQPLVFSRGEKWLIGGWLLAQGSALCGGALVGSSGGKWLLLPLSGAVGVAGIWGGVRWLAHAPRARQFWKRGLIGTFVGVALSTILGYFLQIERVLFGPEWPDYFDRFRIALIWPTRWAMGWAGQIPWENAIYTGLWFALAFGWLATGLAEGRGGWWRWLGLVVAAWLVWLSASRSALVVVMAMSAVGVFFRRRGGGARALVVVASLGLGWGLAQGGVVVKSAWSGVPWQKAAARHQGYLERGSGGRLENYQVLLEEVGSQKLMGRGLAVVGQPVGELLHEHSSYLATYRGAGLGGVLGLGIVAVASLGAAWQRARRGSREALVYWVGAMSAVLFDRSGVLALQPHFEFLVLWSAWLIPFAPGDSE